MAIFQMAENSIRAPKSGISHGNAWQCWFTRASKAGYGSANG